MTTVHPMTRRKAVAKEGSTSVMLMCKVKIKKLKDLARISILRILAGKHA